VSSGVTRFLLAGRRQSELFGQIRRNADAYSFMLDPQKMVRSLSLPNNRHVLVFAVALASAAN
jgi:hypothetical protein